MKRHSIYSATALKLSVCIALLSAVMACTDDNDADTIAQKPIGVSADFGETTRATTQVLLDGNKYTMWASAVYKSDYTSSSFYTPNIYFSPNPLQLSYNPSSNNYIATNYFYPLNGTMRLAAYATNVAVAPTATIEYDANKSFKSMTVDLSASDGLCEVVYSDVATMSCPPTVNPTLHFHRAQTNLRFKFIPVDEYTCKHVIINSIELQEVQWQGIYKVTYDAYGKATHQWTTKGSKGTYTLNVVNKGAVPDENADTRMRWVAGAAVPLEVGDGAHLLPKTDGRTQIIIRYTMLNDPTPTSVGGVGGAVQEDLLKRPEDYKRYLTYVIDAEPTENWEVATQYFYNIKVHGNSQMDVEKVSVAPIVDGSTGTMEI